MLAIEKKLHDLGITVSTLHYQEPVDTLTQQTLALQQGRLNDTGALCVSTGKFTGRSPKDRFIVMDDITRNRVDWGDVNIPFDAGRFDKLYTKVCNYLSAQPALWVRDCGACADESSRINIRVINESPWANLFCSHMFLRDTGNRSWDAQKDWLIVQAPGFLASPEEDGTRQENFSILHFSARIILIGGTAYLGEIKKAIFGVLNFTLPVNNQVLPMHCSANMNEANGVALFFGLSGTGKTTLSADPDRWLIGDDEHGWADGQVFNFEGGCYAKCIQLDEKKEPQIFHAIRDGALLENVSFFENSNKVDYNSTLITENTRAAYPVTYIDNARIPSVGGNPGNIFFLTCDAFGVLPPISQLTRGQAMFHYISGYTAKVAGTEMGVSAPQPVFSACFGRVFLPLHPVEYADLLGEMLGKNPGIKVWLINTGWCGAPGETNGRIPLSYTRALIKAAFSGELDTADFKTEERFGLQIPVKVTGVPGELLHPKNAWANQHAYDAAGDHLATLFIKNFEKYAAKAGAETLAAIPKILNRSAI
ncbi:MAG: phosphoenolpyruvate carboxykinase (ATP) [Flavihumibacter sp.]